MGSLDKTQEGEESWQLATLEKKGAERLRVEVWLQKSHSLLCLKYPAMLPMKN